MQKITMGHQAKFRDENKCFVHVLFLVRAIFTSGILCARLLIEIWIHLADASSHVVVGYACAAKKPF